MAMTRSLSRAPWLEDDFSTGDHNNAKSREEGPWPASDPSVHRLHQPSTESYRGHTLSDGVCRQKILMNLQRRSRFDSSREQQQIERDRTHQIVLEADRRAGPLIAD
jgi:hypothetical protein